ncbi:unnamed protein product [Victoria cruziana]
MCRDPTTIYNGFCEKGHCVSPVEAARHSWSMQGEFPPSKRLWQLVKSVSNRDFQRYARKLFVAVLTDIAHVHSTWHLSLMEADCIGNQYCGRNSSWHF